MKHGPIALIDERTPVVAVATDPPVLGKLMSNLQEVRARGGRLLVVSPPGNEGLADLGATLLPIPAADALVQPVLAAVPLQLLAYRIARLRGLDVDQPRNLAKTVTVE
jgi:glucosamine--fructose-6-phosphate aminotransferase (isomerizing)